MAKTNNLVTKGLQGTLQNLTFVKSERYGDHTRSPRGTFKPAVLNETMEQSKDNLLLVNETASLIFRSINEHKDGTLWTRLLSKLRRQLKEINHNDVHCLLDLECSAAHPLIDVLRDNWYIHLSPIAKRQFPVALKIPEAPVLRKKYLPESQVSLHVIFPDWLRNKLQKVIVSSDVFRKANYPLELSFVIPVPPRAAAYAVFLKVTECEDGIALNYPQSTGMRCVAVGIIPGKKEQPVPRKSAAKKKQAGVRKPKTRAKSSGQMAKGRKKIKSRRQS